MAVKWEPFRNWFGFTRRERRSAFILLLIIILIIGLRYTVPEKNIVVEDISNSISAIGNQTGFLSEEVPFIPQSSSFDPNTESFENLIKLGFTAKEAKTLINYRNKGGKFRNPADIKKVYGIEAGKAEKLLPFIEVRANTTDEVKINSSSQQKLLLDINSTDSASLVRLPGIGPVLSARIIKYRHLIGGFATTEQLKNVYGLSEETYNLIRGSLYADTLAITRININSADYKELVRLPYIEKFEVAAILKYRKLKGRVTGISDLTENKLITEEKAAKVRPYLKFED